jgi:hypothetical protein
MSRSGERQVTTWGSPRQPLMAPAERLGQGQQVRARSPCGASFIVARCPPCGAKESEWRKEGPAMGRGRAAREQHGQDQARARSSATHGGANSRGSRRACPSREGTLPRGKGGLEQCSVPGGAGRPYGAAHVRPALGWRDVAARLERDRNYSD